MEVEAYGGHGISSALILFPLMSIFDNVIAGYKLNGIRLKKEKKKL